MGEDGRYQAQPYEASSPVQPATSLTVTKLSPNVTDVDGSVDPPPGSPSDHSLDHSLGHFHVFPMISGHNDCNVVKKGVPDHTLADRAASHALARGLAQSL